MKAKPIPHSLSAADLEYLATDQEINDDIIDYHCQLLNERFDGRKSVYFVCPHLVQSLQRSDVSQILDQIAHLNLTQYKTVFFPISNLRTQHGHFSLLIWTPNKPKAAVMHLDSLNKRNHKYAIDLFEKLKQIFQIKGKMYEITGPTQTNPVDCGIYVMASYDYIATTGAITKEMNQKISPNYVRNYRRILTNFINHPQDYEFNWENALSELNGISAASDLEPS